MSSSIAWRATRRATCSADMGRYGEAWGDMGRYGEIWGGMGRDGERWGEMGRDGEKNAFKEIRGLARAFAWCVSRVIRQAGAPNNRKKRRIGRCSCRDCVCACVIKRARQCGCAVLNALRLQDQRLDLERCPDAIERCCEAST